MKVLWDSWSLTLCGVMYADDQSARLKQGRGAAGMCSSCLHVPLLDWPPAEALPWHCSHESTCCRVGSKDYAVTLRSSLVMEKEG